MIEEHVACPTEQARRLRLEGVLIVEQGGRGGTADYTGCLAGALAERGVPVTIATADDHLYHVMRGVQIEPIFAYVRGASAAGRLARRMRVGRAVNGLRFLTAMPRLTVLARRSAVTHLQGWERNSLGLIATLLMRVAGARIVYTAHNTFDRLPTPLDSARIFPALAQCTIVHTVADRDRITRPAVVIAHGHYGTVAQAAAAIEASAAREALGLPSDALVVLLFGVLRPDKGLEDLLDAVAQNPPWRALVAGQEGGALRAAAGRISAPELAGRVTVREGFHDMDAVGRFFAAADIVALPYRQASQSGVLHLAYGFGRPVVVYPVGGLVEAVVPGRTGWVCEQATAEALAGVLREAAVLGHDGLRRRGDEGQRWAIETFDWGRIAADTEGVYAAVLKDQYERGQAHSR
jgi:glycosyltransferase involved in cell wall biosynthesis